MSIITSIQQSKKRESRVNLFLDNQFWIGVDKNELISFGLFKGKEISDEVKIEIEKSATFQKLLEKAINYTLVRPRSVGEMITYLTIRRGLSKEESQKVINKLLEKGFLDDQKFTEWYVDNRLNFGTHGENKIRAELSQKGVSKEIVNQVIRSRFQEEEINESQSEKIRTFIEKTKGKIKAESKFELKQKLTQRLLARGFLMKEILPILNNFDL